jgi:hypothetical protein
VLVAVLVIVAGVELLRRQALTEFPAARMHDPWQLLLRRVSGAVRRTRGRVRAWGRTVSEQRSARRKSTGARHDAPQRDAAAPQPATPHEHGASTSLSERLDQLERLAQLRSSGVLSEEEFAAEKRRLLD